MPIFTGSCPAIVTPFSKNGKTINYKSFKNLIEYQIAGGSSAIVFLGTTGESATLSKQEKIDVCKFAVSQVAGRVPVIVGCGSNSTAAACENARLFEKLGADALLCVTPYYNKCSQDGLIKHFSAVAKSTNLPIILYNVPGRTGVNILPETVLKLSSVPNIVAIKEASGNMNQIVDLISMCQDKIDVYSGDDGLTVPIMSMGGKGVISVLANIKPKAVSTMCSLANIGKFDEARKIQLKNNKLIKSLFSDVNPIPVKSALNYLGFDVGPTRLPLSKMKTEKNNKLKKNIDNSFSELK